MSKETTILPAGIDGVLWLASMVHPGNTASVGAQADAVSKIAGVIASFPDPFTQDNYIDLVSRTLGIKAKGLREKVRGAEVAAQQATTEDENGEGQDFHGRIAKAYHLDEEQVKTLKYWGFWKNVDPKKPNKNGYYFAQINFNNYSVKQISNFTILPLYHIKVKRNERRMMCIDNGHQSKIIELDSAGTSSADLFRRECQRYGAFFWRGSSEQLSIVLQAMGHHAFPSCYEIATLGWHPRGFWAFSNAAYNGKLEAYNEYGMYQHENTWYNIPFISPTDADYEDNEESFEFQHYMRYVQSPISFAEWCSLVSRAYLHMGPLAISYSIATLFRDVVLQSAKLPLLYNYGAVNAGKSDFSESISNLFFSGRGPDGEMYKPFNLAQGTDFAFMERMGRFSNSPNILNEFDENKIDEGWFRAIKGAYDGEGREKGDIARAGKTKVQRIRCSIILNGQYLGSKDDNSVVSRSLLNHFAYIAAGDRPADQVSAFTQLKELELRGISSLITTMLDSRKAFKALYPDEFKLAQDYLLQKAQENSIKAQTRLVKNWATQLAAITTMAQCQALPVDTEAFASYCTGMVLSSSAIISSTNTLASFWMVFQNLVEVRDIHQRQHWDLRYETRISVDGKEAEHFPQSPRRILYLRVGAIYPFYAATAHKIRADVFSPRNLENYLRETPYFKGTMANRRFSWTDGHGRTETAVTSCYVFDFDHEAMASLGLPYEPTNSSREAATETPEEKLPF